jgi:hypothetical protein
MCNSWLINDGAFTFGAYVGGLLALNFLRGFVKVQLVLTLAAGHL